MPLALLLRSLCLRPWGPQLETIVLRLGNYPQVPPSTAPRPHQLCPSALCLAPRDLRPAWQGAEKQEAATVWVRPQPWQQTSQPPV